MQYLRIADVNISIDGWRLGGNFASFACEPFARGAICLRVQSAQQSGEDPVTLAQRDGLAESALEWSYSGQYFYRQNASLYFYYEDDDALIKTVISEDYCCCGIFLRPGVADCNMADVEASVSAVLRTVLTGYLATRGGVLLHSASIEWQGAAVAFSAESGTGKSTQAHLWHDRYSVRILDGDSAVCRVIDGAAFLFGLPWCGSSGEFVNAKSPLWAVVFLEQFKENRIRRLSRTEAALRFASRCYLPHWDAALAGGAAMDAAETLSGLAVCCVLKCRPDFEAVELLKSWLDQNKPNK